ncbi:MAG TPA: aminopeptidase P family protein [bacterium]|nr:aminopeptidase P family protein [bacterium]
MPNRIAALQSKLVQEKLDALLVYSAVNRNYLSRFTGSSGALLVTLKQAWFLTDSRYTLQAGRQVQGARVLLQKKNLLVEAMALIKAHGLRRVGFEAGHVTVAEHQFLCKELPKAQWLPTRGLVEGFRLIKDAEEREALRAAARIADRTFHHILPFIKPGVREDALAGEMEHFFRRQGAEGPSFETIVASGWRSALPHGVASDKRVEKGDMIVFDFGCRYQGYCSDMSRSVVVGRPSPLQRKIYGIVQKAQAAGLAAARPGRRAGDVDAASRGVIARAGYAKLFGHGTGHGVGAEVHENPRVGPKAPEALVPGVAITVEPGIYLDGRFGVRIEDLVLITKAGHENLYRSTKQLITV